MIHAWLETSVVNLLECRNKRETETKEKETLQIQGLFNDRPVTQTGPKSFQKLLCWSHQRSSTLFWGTKLLGQERLGYKQPTWLSCEESGRQVPTLFGEQPSFFLLISMLPLLCPNSYSCLGFCLGSLCSIEGPLFLHQFCTSFN